MWSCMGKTERKIPLQFVKRFTPFEKIGWVEKYQIQYI